MLDSYVLIRRYQHKMPSDYKPLEYMPHPRKKNVLKIVYKPRAYIQEFTVFKFIYIEECSIYRIFPYESHLVLYVDFR